MDRLDRLSELFLAATMRKGAARDEVLTAARGAGLGGELERLLDADARNEDGFLAVPLIDGRAEGSSPSGSSAVEAGTLLGGCVVKGVLARGVNSSVYLGEQPSTDRRVAIKVLDSGSAREILVRFEQERRIVAKLNHENIAALHDAGATADGRAFFVMEYVDGRPITLFCEERGLSLRARLGLFIQLCGAIEHAHLHGIIHRDLKPSNILVTGGESPVVKVIDFGIAKSMDRVADHASTAHGQVLGTIGYMAPEQLDGGGAFADTRSDCYALGAVLYEMLTGMPAVATENAGPLTILARITTEEPVRPSKIRARLRGDLERIIGRALTKDAGRRYQSVEGLRADVERFLAGRPVTAHRPSPVYVMSRLIGRHRWYAAAVLVLVLAAGVSGYRWWRAERAKFDLAVAMAHSWFDQSRSMARTVGERRHRGPLLSRLDAQSESLLGQARGHAGVVDLRADVLGACGDFELENGKAEAARERFERVLELRKGLVAAVPASLEERANLSVALVRLGDVSWAMGDVAGAKAKYVEALALDEALVRQHPWSARALTLLAWSCDRLAAMATIDGDEAATSAYYSRGLELFRALTTVEVSADAHRGLSTAYMHVGQFAGRKGDRVTQRRCYERALIEADRAVALEPEDRLAVWNQMSVRQACFEAMWQEMDSGAALALAVEIVDIAQRIVTRDPEDFVVRNSLAMAFLHAAQCAERDGNTGLAARYRAEEVNERGRILNHRPRDPEVRAAHSVAVEAAVGR